VSAGAGVGGGAGGASSSADLSSMTDFDDGTGGMQQSITDGTVKGGTLSGEAAVMDQAGPAGRSIAHGGTPGGVEGQLTGEGEIQSAQGQIRGTQQGAGMDVRATIDSQRSGAESTTGYSDPVSEAGRIEQGEWHARDGMAAQGQVATSKVDEARRVTADPRGTATGEAGMRIDAETGGAQSDVREVRSTVENPEAAAQGRADAKIAEQKRDVEASATGNVSVSSDGSASVETTTDKPGKK
jgi:hypothetical protein